MKSSSYNVVVPCRKGFALFNTLTGSILFVDEEMKNALEREEFEKINEENIKSLNKMGVITHDDVDERRILSYKLKNLIYASANASFSVLPTYKCNLKCPYCYEGSGEIHRGTMTDEMVNTVIQGIETYCLEKGIRNLGIVLYGGEPLLHKKASIKLVETLGTWAENHSITYRCKMITNGTLLTEQVLSEFEPFLDMVQLTLDGPQPFHNKKRMHKNGEGTYEEVLEAVSAARNCNIRVMLRIQVSADTLSEMDTLFGDLVKRGLHTDQGVHSYMFPLIDINEVCSSYASLCSEEDAQMLPVLWRKARSFGIEMVSKPVQIFYSPYCSFATNHSFLVDAVGDVYKCVSVVGEKQYRVGCMTERGLQDIQPELYAFTARDPTDIEKCNPCTLLPLCGGGCAHRAYQQYKSYSEGYCTLHKGLEEEKLLLYLERAYPDRFG
jgi:uncharacterized protein